MFGANWNDDAIRDAVSNLEASLEEEAHAGVDDVARVIADAARTQHAYTNRTGMLEHMTLPGRTDGSFANGTLNGYVTADTEYGEFVEFRWGGKFSFLRPANQRTQTQQSAALERFLERAVKRSRGWK